MLTEGELAAIRNRAARARMACDYLIERAGEGAISLPPPVGSVIKSSRDVPDLLHEIERLADLLSDCWLVLDEIARPRDADPAQFLAAMQREAAQLLRRHQAPGWKKPITTENP